MLFQSRLYTDPAGGVYSAAPDLLAGLRGREWRNGEGGWGKDGRGRPPYPVRVVAYELLIKQTASK